MKKILITFVIIITVCFSVVFIPLHDKTPEPQGYEYIKTEDIEADCTESQRIIENGEYDINVSDVYITVPEKPTLSDEINSELSEWEKYAIEQIQKLDDLLQGEGYGYCVKTSVTYNHEGLLSLGSFIEYTNYGENYRAAVCSAVWDLGKEKKITPLQMLDMGAEDYENFLTVNIDNELQSYAEYIPYELKNAAGRYSEYMGYYITDCVVVLYTMCRDMDYTIGYIELKMRFSEDPGAFKYNISRF